MIAIKQLLNEQQVFLDVPVKTQKAALEYVAKIAKAQGIITNQNDLVKTFLVREKINSTGFENGFALPHAQSDNISRPAIFILRTITPIQWQAVDGQLTDFIVAILIPKSQVSNIHLDIISKIAMRLVNEDVRQQLKTTNDKQTLISLLNFYMESGASDSQATVKSTVAVKKRFVGISSCTTGVVHTYMCKEALEQAGKELGYDVHIECQGQKGQEYLLSADEIKAADAVILATDVAVDLDRFHGKKTYNVGTKTVLKDPKKVLTDALEKATVYGDSAGNSDFIMSASGDRKGILKHLLSGVSFMIPFVVFAGLIFAVVSGIAKGAFGTAFEFQGSWEDQIKWVAEHLASLKTGVTPNGLMHTLMIINNVAGIGFTLMIPIMGAYIAYSIAGRPGIAPAMIVTFLLVTPNSGMWWDWNGTFLFVPGFKGVDAHLPFSGVANISWTLFGALFGGLVCGYFVKYVNSWKVPKWLLPIMPIIIIPVFCTALVALPTAFFLAAPFGYIMGALDYGLSWMGINPSIGFLVGLILGAMVGFDMGGPINKTAVLVATSLLIQDNGRLMGPVAAAIPIAPLGCALTSTVLGRKMFSKQEQSLGWNAWLLGFMGISESAIPFAARDTWRTIVANVIGSAVAGALAFAFGVLGHVGAWGSFIIALFGGVTDTAGSYVGIIWYVIAILIGMVVHSLIYTSLLLAKSGNFSQTVARIFKKAAYSKKTNKVTLEK